MDRAKPEEQSMVGEQNSKLSVNVKRSMIAEQGLGIVSKLKGV